MARRVVVLSALGIVAAPPASAQNANINVSQVVGNVQAVNASATTFSADFTLKTAAKHNSTTTSSGHVVLSSGGRMDWVYGVPPGNRVVSNGTNVCVYDATNRELDVQVMTKSPYAVVGTLLTSGNLQAFSFTASAAPNGGYMLLGTWTPSAGTDTSVYVSVGPTYDIERILVFGDEQSERFLFEFTNVKRNVPVASTQFVMSLPPGSTLAGSGGKTAAPSTCP